MKQTNRELVLLLKIRELNSPALEKELDSLELMLDYSESPDLFIHSHELVNRTGITNRKNKLLKCYYRQDLKAFQFLICKN
jgi:hypothetical protein